MLRLASALSLAAVATGAGLRADPIVGSSAPQCVSLSAALPHHR